MTRAGAQVAIDALRCWSGGAIAYLRGALGLTEDFPFIGRLLFLNPQAKSLSARAWWRLVDKIVTPISQHTRFFLFQKADVAERGA